jgi:hypothetical protein
MKMLNKGKAGFSLKLFAVIFGLLLITVSIYGQEEKFKALFIYNFTKYIQWPENVEGDFKITIIGNIDLVKELDFIATKKTVGQSAIIVLSAKSAALLKKCQMVFVSRDKIDELPDLIDKAKQFNALIITESPNACSKGSAINFVTSNGSIKFEISKSNIENAGLKISGALLNLGIVLN